MGRHEHFVRAGEELPVLPLRETVVFPRELTQFIVARPSSIQMLGTLAATDHRLVLVAQRERTEDDPQLSGLYPIGTAAIVLKSRPAPGGQGYSVVVEGLQRVRLLETAQLTPLRARIEPLDEIAPPLPDPQYDALIRSVRSLFASVVRHSPHLSGDLEPVAEDIQDGAVLADFVAAHLSWIDASVRQEILQTLEVRARLQRLTEVLGRELEGLELEQRIRTEIHQRFATEQKEAFLREEIKAFQRELGERDPESRATAELEERLRGLALPQEARTETDRELRRLQALPAGASESAVVRTWLDLVVALPWGKATAQRADVKRAQEILDQDHDDLARVKERIVEHLAVQQLRPEGRSPILCFVGPPGVGKTSLGRSIARALGRAFVRVSLGGTHDEAEIRGHRRTYIGALPGQILLGMRRAGTCDPVFMLDEIDKLGRDFHGDPAAALLEALDPEQNANFRDHYLDLPFDLSKVLFITTANALDPVPPTLLDRMEVLELPGYSEEEKLLIARHHLVPRQVTENGLDASRIEFADGALLELIRCYTAEAGVRNLERQLGRLCRKHARAVAAEGPSLLQVTPEVVRGMLGAPPYRVESDLVERTRTPGVVVGLAWTPQGGDVLFVEATRLPNGHGELLVTGHVGAVMQESMRAALSWLRASGLVDAAELARSDVHVHVPAGAVPKDGPSAGAAIAAALYSLFLRRPARPLLAITGEITLSGRVLPVGGLKEKVLAARRCGVRELVLPALNQPQLLEDVAPELREGLTFHFVRTLEEALDVAVGRPAPQPAVLA